MEQTVQFLLAASLKAGILIIMLFAIQLLFSRWLTPKWRHLLWCLVAVRLLLPPVFETDFSIFNLGENLKQSETTVVLPQTIPVELEMNAHRATPMVSTPAVATSTVATSTVATSTFSDMLAKTSLWHVLFGVWSLGAISLLGVICWATIRLHLAIRRHRPSIVPELLTLLEECKDELGVTATVTLIETTAVNAPALLGIIQPKLLLPKGMSQALSSREIRFVFLHELTHLKRRDILINWLVTFAQIIHWFNPLVWLAFIRMHADREQACDESVLLSISEPERKLYGHTLIDLMGTHPAPPAVTGMVGILENHKQLKRRIKMIHQFKNKPAVHALFACFIAICVAAISLTDATAKEDKAEQKKEGNKYDIGEFKKLGARTHKAAIVKTLEALQKHSSTKRGMTGYELSEQKRDLEVMRKYLIKEPDALTDDEMSTFLKAVNSYMTTVVEYDKYVSALRKARKSGEDFDPMTSRGIHGKMRAARKARRNARESVKPKKATLKTYEKMKTITITRISFVDTPVSIILEFLKTTSRVLDPTGEGVNFMLKLPKGKKEPALTLDLDKVPLLKAIEYVCKASDLKFVVDDNVVLVGDFKPIKAGKKATKLTKKLNDIVISKARFNDTPLNIALKFLKGRSQALDPTGKGITILLINTSKRKIPTVTMDLDNVRLGHVIDYLCQSVNVNYTTDGAVVVILK